MIKPQDINLKELEDKRFPKVHNIMVVEDKIKQFLSDKLNRIEKKAFCRYCGKSVNEESSEGKNSPYLYSRLYLSLYGISFICCLILGISSSYSSFVYCLLKIQYFFPRNPIQPNICATFATP